MALDLDWPKATPCNIGDITMKSRPVHRYLRTIQALREEGQDEMIWNRPWQSRDFFNFKLSRVGMKKVGGHAS